MIGVAGLACRAPLAGVAYAVHGRGERPSPSRILAPLRRGLFVACAAACPATLAGLVFQTRGI